MVGKFGIRSQEHGPSLNITYVFHPSAQKVWVAGKNWAMQHITCWLVQYQEPRVWYLFVNNLVL
jgi:hypothetical protein